MTKWENVIGCNDVALKDFVVGNLSCEQVQVAYRNKFPEASSEIRNLIRTRGTKEARRLTRNALRRRGLV